LLEEIGVNRETIVRLSVIWQIWSHHVILSSVRTA